MLAKLERVFILTLMLILAAASASWAETDFSGEVSGIWNVQGNPYVQIGAANVPQGRTLTILPGVKVVLSADQEFVISGLLTAIGTEEDTIRFHQPDSTVVGTLRLENSEDTIRFQYCRFDSLREAIQSDNQAIRVENCLFFVNRMHLDLVCFNAIIENNRFIGTEDGAMGSFHFGLPNRRNGIYLLTNNEIQGRGTIGFSDADRVEFRGNRAISSPMGNVADLNFWNCVIIECNGNTGWFPMNMANDFRRLNRATINQNELLNININTEANWGIVLSDNCFRAVCSIGGPGADTFARAEFDDNEFGYTPWADASIICENAEVKMERNTLGILRLGDGGNMTMSNNTLTGAILGYVNGANNSRLAITNNIFQSFGQLGYLVNSAIDSVAGGYNCFWGEERPYGAERDLLRGDIIRDPLMRGGIPYDYRLRADSPCIDTGDPNSPHDSDGTRADIGCYFFDQQNGEPPALDRKWDYYIGWNEVFRYAAKAVDEGQRLDIQFENLPDWVGFEQRRDLVRDTVVVSGVVPEGQQDFVFNVIARDDADQEDTLSVRVMVYPYRVLTGIVHGTLDINQSPFIVADTAWVPAGDSLVLPPGTQLYFDNRNDTLSERVPIMLVAGKIVATGAENDSIYVLPYQQNHNSYSFRFLDNQADVSNFTYCYFRALPFLSHGQSLVINHCLFDSTYSVGITGSVHDIVVENSTFLETSIGLCGKGKIQGNQILSSPGSGIIVQGERDGDTITVRSNVLLNCAGGISTMGASYTLVEDNTVNSLCDEGYVAIDINIMDNVNGYKTIVRSNKITGGWVGVEIAGSYIEAIVQNNLISGASWLGAWSIFRSDSGGMFSNNIIFNSPIGFGLDNSWHNNGDYYLPVFNNIFLNDSILMEVSRPEIPFDNFRFNSVFEVDSLGNQPDYVGKLTQVNANGDSCDAHFNIYPDPRLANPDTLDFRLYANSPLINAGDPDSSFNDLDGSVNDIGLFGGPHGRMPNYLDTLTVSSPAIPLVFHVGQAYPNPFNGRVTLAFSLPQPLRADLAIYDITGRFVTRLAQGDMKAGAHTFIWNAQGASSGIYLARLSTSNGNVAERKLVLLK